MQGRFYRLFLILGQFNMSASNQFSLLGQRRFAPFFWTQFLGAGNDNLFKFAIVMMVTYQLQISWLPPDLAGAVIGGVFILPFFFFSATSGQFADKFDKSHLIRFVKWLELTIMALGAWGFYSLNVPLLLLCVLLMGLHSTIFGPVKYSYMPQHLSERELTGGNGMVEMGTFVSILLGQVVGGLLIAMPEVGHHYVACLCLILAAMGCVTAHWVPSTPATDPGLRLNWNPFTETWRNLRLAQENSTVFRSLLGISWMWFFGAAFVSLFPSFAKDVLHGDEQVASLLLVVFSLGVGVGSLMCEVLSRRQVEIGLVPLGAIGMSLFAADLYWASLSLAAPTEAWGVNAFLAQPAHWRVIADLALLAIFAGFFSVPMYALIQMRSQPSHRARIIAANNILNALFMMVSALLVSGLLALHWTIPEIILVVGVLNALVAAYIFYLVPEYLLRFLAFILTRCIYRFRVFEGEHIPTEGPAILICNHVSFMDPVLMAAASPRPIRFIMDHRVFASPVLGLVFRLAKTIPIAPQREDPQIYESAFVTAREVLNSGELLAIFPEGAITRDGKIAEFKGGIIKILQANPVPVVPMALQNLWGSFFSRIDGRAMSCPFRRGLFNSVKLVVGAPLAPEEASLAHLQSLVKKLHDMPPEALELE